MPSRFVIPAAVAAALAATLILAGAPPLPATIALLAVYVFGYVVGALILSPAATLEGLSVALIRTVAGLLMTTIGFLLSLKATLPWYSLPGVLVVTALVLHRARALLLPPVRVRLGWDGAVAGAFAVIILSPVLISVCYMGQGHFPPVFYNIDTAYFMEKVHGLTAASAYPPESLSNLGVQRAYHYGTQAMAALLSRTSGLPPHQSVFLVLVPLLSAGGIAAAAAAARHVAPALPRSLTVPLLLVSIPSITTPFWLRFGPQAWAFLTGGFSVDALVGQIGLWGILSNEGQNVGGDFLILASVAGIAAAPVWGWRLPALLIGSGILVKTPVGVALVAGFGLTEIWRALRTRQVRPSPQSLLAAAIFAIVLLPLFVVGFESPVHLEHDWFVHLRQLDDDGRLVGVAIDAAWLLLPAWIVLIGVRDPTGRSAPLLLMSLAPLIVVNVSRLENNGIGGGGAGNDWLQILHPVPFLLHAFALSLASARWTRLGRPRRVAFLVITATMLAPVIVAGARYSASLVIDPRSGNEFVDNRVIAEALAAVPTEGTILVTNDLRYPAQNFARTDRQAQIPAIFGHQAFAVNYAYESVEERRPLQALLSQVSWDPAVLDAARANGWTHFLVRKDYVHPDPIPIERVFENQDYAVYRFPEGNAPETQ